MNPLHHSMKEAAERLSSEPLSTQINFRVSESFSERIKVAAKKGDRTVTGYLKMLIKKDLESNGL